MIFSISSSWWWWSETCFDAFWCFKNNFCITWQLYRIYFQQNHRYVNRLAQAGNFANFVDLSMLSWAQLRKGSIYGKVFPKKCRIKDLTSKWQTFWMRNVNILGGRELRLFFCRSLQILMLKTLKGFKVFGWLSFQEGPKLNPVLI